MTEDEAKTKWCPFVRGDNSDNAINRWCDGKVPDGQYAMAYCIGSQCMAWRWRMSPADAAQVNARGNAGAEAGGYCGLADKQQ